ncbi:MAG: AAA family ATPase [Clostridium sp.]|nr:AAA family ATPase [Clostridium sp.]MDU7082932.1 AAA family ATPase [Clostridium sp.]
MSKAQEINKLYDELVQKNEVWSEAKVKEYYTNFKDKFSVDKLKALSGKEVLSTIFEMSNRESLVYWLEFKKDEEFEQRVFGSIAGGSSYKYGLFYKANEGWVHGTSPKSGVNVTEEEAVDIAIQKRDLLVKGAEIIAAVNEERDESYNELQRRLEEECEIANQAWVHKYYHMIFPDKLDTFHKLEFHKYYIAKFLEGDEEAKVEEKMYSMAAPIIRFAKKTKVSVANCLQLSYRAFGSIQNYWEIDGDLIENYKESYLANGIFGLADVNKGLSSYKGEKFGQFKGHLEALDETIDVYRGRDLYELMHSIKINDTLIICENQVPAYIGKVAGEYEYEVDDLVNHRRKVIWTKVAKGDKKIISKNSHRVISFITDLQSMINIEKLRTDAVEVTEAVKTEVKESKIDELNPIQKKIKSILDRKGQVILFGPPGTGKSYWGEGTCKELASAKVFGKSFSYLTIDEKKLLEGTGDTLGIVNMCCFHPTYGYEDFIEGIKPKVVEGKTIFELRDGIFKRVCKAAVENPLRDYYLIIDEINRGDISRIFGELITVLEKSKRAKEIILPLSGERFKVPNNLYIVGTMNTTDKSIAYLDIALRRRFGFVELMPDVNLLMEANIDGLNLGLWLREINSNIKKYLGADGRNMQIGHSYLLEGDKPLKTIEQLACVVREDIIPLIEEYCYGDFTSLENILGTGIVSKKKQELELSVLELQVDKSDYIAALKAVNPEVFIGEEDIEEEEDNNE